MEILGLSTTEVRHGLSLSDKSPETVRGWCYVGRFQIYYFDRAKCGDLSLAAAAVPVVTGKGVGEASFLESAPGATYNNCSTGVSSLTQIRHWSVQSDRYGLSHSFHSRTLQQQIKARHFDDRLPVHTLVTSSSCVQQQIKTRHFEDRQPVNTPATSSLVSSEIIK
ncbi:hypothetical protein Btru_049702 [Bulinus truncatus]|nr:hypothetical protein Btru_049702 [Bulinus truncatus]